MSDQRPRVAAIAEREGLPSARIEYVGSGACHDAFVLRAGAAGVVVRIRREMCRDADDLCRTMADYEGIARYFDGASLAAPGFYPGGYRYAELESGWYYTRAEYIEPGAALEDLPREGVRRAGGHLADRFQQLAVTPAAPACAVAGRLTWSSVAGLESDGAGGAAAKLASAVNMLRPMWPAVADTFGSAAAASLVRNIRVAATALEHDAEPLTYVNVDLNPDHFVFAADGTVRLFDPSVFAGPRSAALAQCAFACGCLWPNVYRALASPLADRAQAFSHLANSYLEALAASVSQEELLRVRAHVFTEILDRGKGIIAHAVGRLPEIHVRQLFGDRRSFDRFASGLLSDLWRYSVADGIPAVA